MRSVVFLTAVVVGLTVASYRAAPASGVELAECRARPVVEQFVSSFNSGDLGLMDELVALYAEGWQWYSVGDPAGQRLSPEAMSRDSLRAYFASRIGKHEVLRVLTFRENGGGHFGFTLSRRADDLDDGSPVERVGKGWVNCSVGKLAVWSLGTASPSRFDVCNPTPLTRKPPDSSLRGLSSNWARVGTLWMGYTHAHQGFLSLPRGQKIAWWRGKGSVFGKLRVTGERLDAEAPPLRARIPTGYTKTTGFQSSALYFSTPGCWQIVARVGLSQRYVFRVTVSAAPEGLAQWRSRRHPHGPAG